MNKILVLDVSAIMYRAHYAMIKFTTSNGISNGAILGFIKQLEAAINYFNPKYIIAAKDVRRASLKRKEIYSEYKENRESMPIELASQIDDIDNILLGYSIPIIKIEGYEADDVIASITNKFKNENEIIILTGDKDLSQLVEENVKVALMKKGKDNEPYLLIKDEKDVIDYLGVKPELIKDLFGLMGDSSDGIPGVKGIGGVTGVKLINEYGTLENIYDKIDEIKGKTKEKLLNDKEMAFISRNLATIFSNLKIDLELENKPQKDINILKEVFLKYELRKEYEKLLGKFEDDEEELNIESMELSFSNLIDKINENAKEGKEISLFYGEEGISIFDGEKSYYSLEKEFDEVNIFEVSKKITDIDNNLKPIIIYNKEWLNLGISFSEFKDILLANYTLGTDKIQKIENILFENIKLSVESLEKKELKKLSSNDLKKYNISRLTKISYGMYKVFSKLLKKIEVENLMSVYEFETKFTKVLKYMEDNGIFIDEKYFKAYDKELDDRLKVLEEEIYAISGEKFNISSPKQLAYILFEKLEIKYVKKTKTGYSTDAEVLEILNKRGIEIAGKLIEYREVEKLKSTYTSPLITLSNKGKIHTTYNQMGTATGRLSSNNPNLQNIPTRTEDGLKIRKGFVAEVGKEFMGFDYSQIELRVLAHLSKDENLINAYKNNLDLHELTAKKIFMLKDDQEVSKYQRNIAKVINFSVLYGKSAFGLSKELDITVQDAKKYIDTYFEQYPNVRKFLDKIIEDAKKLGYVETLYNTRRHVSGVNSSNANIREAANRMAVNTVIQGTAANIIKKVMLEIYEKLCDENLKMLLQVHDELIFEVDNKNIEICNKIKEIMEGYITFEDVKLSVNYNHGKSWMELK